MLARPVVLRNRGNARQAVGNVLPIVGVLVSPLPHLSPEMTRSRVGNCLKILAVPALPVSEYLSQPGRFSA